MDQLDTNTGTIENPTTEIAPVVEETTEAGEVVEVDISTNLEVTDGIEGVEELVSDAQTAAV